MLWTGIVIIVSIRWRSIIRPVLFVWHLMFYDCHHVLPWPLRIFQEICSIKSSRLKKLRRILIRIDSWLKNLEYFWIKSCNCKAIVSHELRLINTLWDWIESNQKMSRTHVWYLPTYLLGDSGGSEMGARGHGPFSKPVRWFEVRSLKVTWGRGDLLRWVKIIRKCVKMIEEHS